MEEITKVFKTVSQWCLALDINVWFAIAGTVLALWTIIKLVQIGRFHNTDNGVMAQLAEHQKTAHISNTPYNERKSKHVEILKSPKNRILWLYYKYVISHNDFSNVMATFTLEEYKRVTRRKNVPLLFTALLVLIVVAAVAALSLYKETNFVFTLIKPNTGFGGLMTPAVILLTFIIIFLILCLYRRNARKTKEALMKGMCESSVDFFTPMDPYFEDFKRALMYAATGIPTKAKTRIEAQVKNQGLSKRKAKTDAAPAPAAVESAPAVHTETAAPTVETAPAYREPVPAAAEPTLETATKETADVTPAPTYASESLPAWLNESPPVVSEPIPTVEKPSPAAHETHTETTAEPTHAETAPIPKEAISESLSPVETARPSVASTPASVSTLSEPTPVEPLRGTPPPAPHASPTDGTIEPEVEKAIMDRRVIRVTGALPEETLSISEVIPHPQSAPHSPDANSSMRAMVSEMVDKVVNRVRTEIASESKPSTPPPAPTPMSPPPPTPAPEPLSSPESVPSPTPVPASAPTPEPVSAPEPTSEPIPPSPTPEPTSEPIPPSMHAPAPTLSPEPTPEPTPEPAPKLQTEAPAESTDSHVSKTPGSGGSPMLSAGGVFRGISGTKLKNLPPES